MNQQAQTIGEQLRKRRNQIEMTQSDLAEKSGITKEYISKIENGHATNVGTDILENLAKVLGLSLSLLPQPEAANE